MTYDCISIIWGERFSSLVFFLVWVRLGCEKSCDQGFINYIFLWKKFHCFPNLKRTPQEFRREWTMICLYGAVVGVGREPTSRHQMSRKQIINQGNIVQYYLYNLRNVKRKIIIKTKVRDWVLIMNMKIIVLLFVWLTR